MTNLRMQLFLGHVAEFHGECFSGNKINNSVIESCLKYNERNSRKGSGYKNKFTDNKEEKILRNIENISEEKYCESKQVVR